jgi:hypothetical protein
METTTVKRPDPTVCPHTSIVRVLDSWECVECRAEFMPKNKEHRTGWKKYIQFKPTS